ncbi:MAG: efflux RND transporter permease subunit [Bacteroidales bacterium]|nr:efflux RND transporter permease subunit [Bacteroidales bacterium]
MKIYEAAVKKPVTTIMIFLAIIVTGVYSLTQLAIDYFPEIELPALTLVTTYRGADAKSIEENITKILEQQLSSLNRLKKLTSRSNDNISIITAEFEYGTNLDEAANDIRDIIDRILPYLPDDIDRPAIFKFSSSMLPILIYTINADQNYEGLEKIIENKIINPLNRIDGVANVMLFGLPTRVIYIEFDPAKLENYNITINQVVNILKAQNINYPLGNIKTQQLEYRVTMEGEFPSSDLIKDIFITLQNGKNVYLKDIAVVKDTLKDFTQIESINGEKGIRMAIIKQSGANTLKVASKAINLIEEAKKTLPSDIKINIVFDTSNNIKAAITNLAKTILFAFIFVSIVVFLFLGRIRQSLIIIAVIPISLVSGFIYLYGVNDSLNLISLSAITIAIGMVVDDAIVVIENITKHIERGSTPKQSAVNATNEVWVAVIATTIVIVVVFLPMSFASGLTGVLFKSLGWIVTITIILSTITAISLTPMLSSIMLKENSTKKQNLWNKTFGHLLNKLDELYHNFIRFVLRHKIPSLLIAIIIFISSLFLIKVIGTDFFPLSDHSVIRGTIQIQTGVNLEETKKIIKKLENIIETRYPEKLRMVFSAGTSERVTFLSAFLSNSNSVINVLIRLKDREERKRSIFEIIDDLRSVLDTMPEIVKYNFTSETTMGGMGGNTIDIKIFGYDLDKSTSFALKIKEELKKIKEAKDITISRENDNPQLKIFLKNDKLSQLGLNTAIVSNELRSYITGITATKYKEEGNEYEVIVRLNDQVRNNIEILKNLSINTPFGTKVKLHEIADIKEEWVPPSIEHENKQRIIKVSVKPGNISLGQLANQIQNIVNKIEKPEGIDVVVGGAFQDQMDAFKDLAFMFVVAIILVYLTMAAQFESLTMPIIIMTAIPFVISGSLIALFITGKTLSVNAAIGIIMLIGIATKNSIVLVDFINLLRDRGQSLIDAITNAARSRLRPILMTAVTTLFGMLPMALSTGEGSEQWSVIGISVIGGLFFSTIISLIIVPVSYYIFIRIKNEKLVK